MSQSQTEITTKDVVILGGGMIGAATAIGLAQLGLSVTVIEAFRPEAYSSEQAIDLRVSAISVTTEKLLDNLGALESLTQMRRAPYLGLETWELEGCITRFHADSLGVSHLGHIVENRLIQLALWEQFESLDNLELLCPRSLASFSRSEHGVCVTLDNGQRLDAKLLVGADGANSQVRTWAGIGSTGWDYAQSAMLINIETALEQQDVTWQQFTPKGPRSLLPLPGNNASLVWYDDASRIAQLSQLSNAALAQQIKMHFPERLDRQFEVVNKGSFKLTRRHAQSYFSDNLVILGDAAHTINPLAGQGVNIGFKDVDALISVISNKLSQQEVWWSNSVLSEYQSRRYRDNQLMMSAMDLFYAGFSNDLLPLKVLRNAALKLANIDSPIKKQVLKYAMGL
ncbi:FAD-dependent oxidoreductase [Shewanella violacea]|uniref:2-octaprenyl-3-methyl-6-methoxy-1,4-benzoquinol hydroxylase, putative n=1 Tax=Shewanella violacea (strain JCM 10179 / CIP 106290 / LMG 19151 / DSS12) TaxID=637905 RepID=D4ZBG7_SHEVD|nr:FAD-dependent oxidoreductase [Shewanella violacea]BAJ03362.1 2-octaprenyl-3-methyl-6-methoxy-1,4-benzoquinol hydroxylase, putative [Shewanella violacea DSS12]